MTHSMFTTLQQISFYTDLLNKLLAGNAQPEHEKWFQVGIAISKLQQLSAELMQHCLLHTREKFNLGSVPYDPDHYTTKEG